MNWNRISFGGIALAVVMMLSSCKKEAVNTPVNPNNTQVLKSQIGGAPSEICGNATTVALLAGQTINAGTVSVANDANNVYVTYTTANGWSISELHLYIGDCNGIPVNGAGNPVPGHFPYSTSFNQSVQQYTFVIPISQLPSCYCVAAHAVVGQGHGKTETAWGAGTRITSKGNWATKFYACNQNCINSCALGPDYWFGDNEVTWPENPVRVGGQLYTQPDGYTIFFLPSSDSRTAFIYIASARLSGSSIDAADPIWNDINLVNNWLNTVGRVEQGNTPAAPANIQTSLNNIVNWFAAHPCR